MVDIIKILKREQEEDNLIYVYEENGCWYAYEKSAYYLSQMLKGKLSLERFTIENDILWLVRAKVSFEFLPHEHFTSCGDYECVINYIPHYGMQDWLTQVQ